MDLKRYYTNLEQKIEDGTVEDSDINVLVFDCMMSIRRFCKNGSMLEAKQYVSDLTPFNRLLGRILKEPDKYKNIEKLVQEIDKFKTICRFCRGAIPAMSTYVIEICNFLMHRSGVTYETICEKMNIKKVDMEKIIKYMEEKKLLEITEVCLFEKEEKTKLYSLTREAVKGIREDKTYLYHI